MEPTGFLNNLDKSRRIQLVWEKTYVSPYLKVEFSRVSQTNNSINSALRDSVCLLGFRLAITLGRKKKKNFAGREENFYFVTAETVEWSLRDRVR